MYHGGEDSNLTTRATPLLLPIHRPRRQNAIFPRSPEHGGILLRVDTTISDTSAVYRKIAEPELLRLPSTRQQHLPDRRPTTRKAELESAFLGRPVHRCRFPDRGTSRSRSSLRCLPPAVGRQSLQSGRLGWRLQDGRPAIHAEAQ